MASSPRSLAFIALIGLAACGNDKYIYDDAGTFDDGAVDSGSTSDDTGSDGGSDDSGTDGGSDDSAVDGTDGDGDGYVSEADGGTDCDDTNNSIYPGATEICNGKDDNCDGETDEDLAIEPLCLDDDGDGYGDASTESTDCQNEGWVDWVSDCTDCDDAADGIHPGADEICDGSTDEDCDGLIDDDDDSLAEQSTTTWYADNDGDSWGDWENTVQSCEQPSGTVTVGRDCDDNDPELTPDSGCTGDWDGTYNGDLSADFTETLFGLEDTCAGSIELVVETYGETPIMGSMECTFAGTIALLLGSDPLEGDITGDFVSADEGTLTADFGGLFTVEMDVTFSDPDTATGAWAGTDSSTGFTVVYDGTFEATR